MSSRTRTSNSIYIDAPDFPHDPMDEEPQEPTSTPTTAATPTPVVGLQHTLNPASNPASIERPGITDDDNDDDDDDDMNESTEAGRTTTRRSGVSPTDNRHYLDGQSTSTTRSDRDDHPIDTSSAMDIDEDEEVMMHGGGGSSSSRSNNTSYPGSISSGSASSGLRSTLATWTNGQGSTTTTTTITTAVAPPTTGSTSSSSTPPPPLIEPSSTGAAAASSSSTSSGGGGTSTTTTTTTTTTPTATTGSGSKSSAPVVDEKAQSELRRKIMEIQRDPNIAFAAKAGMIQKLMSSKWHSQQTPGTQKDDDEADVEASEDDLKTTYYNAELGQLGCKHYRRGCKLKANCCGKWFNCRFCHDDVCDHAIVRNETRTMLCMKCKTVQPAAQDCSSCHVRLAGYYCDVCKLWDDDPEKPIYHCDDCGICRIGRGLGQDYFHCKKCNVCMNINYKADHRCIERNLECDCPICGEYMFTSTTTVIFMPCGHCIHSKCHEDYIKTSYQCPTCWKALGNMSGYYAKIDSLLAEQTMPPEYANIFSNVLCNDCEVKSEAPYHFLYHRCDKCKGYNTKVLDTFKRVSNGQVEQVEVAAAVAEAAAAAGSSSSSSSSGGGVSGGNGGGGDSNSGGESTTTTGTMRVSGIGGVGIIGVGVAGGGGTPLMDQNASGDMTMAGISGNSAP